MVQWEKHNMENTLAIILLLSAVLNIVLLFRGTNLVRIIENLQRELLESNDDAIRVLNSMYKKMQDIDIRGSFESDDEVGSVFSELKNIIEEYKNRF